MTAAQQPTDSALTHDVPVVTTCRLGVSNELRERKQNLNTTGTFSTSFAYMNSDPYIIFQPRPRISAVNFPHAPMGMGSLQHVVSDRMRISLDFLLLALGGKLKHMISARLV